MTEAAVSLNIQENTFKRPHPVLKRSSTTCRKCGSPLAVGSKLFCKDHLLKLPFPERSTPNELSDTTVSPRGTITFVHPETTLLSPRGNTTTTTGGSTVMTPSGTITTTLLTTQVSSSRICRKCTTPLEDD